MANALNLYRQTKDGSLDKKFLRVCSVYRLLKKQIIGRGRALELLAQRHSAKEMKILRGTVELWKSPIPAMKQERESIARVIARATGEAK